MSKLADLRKVIKVPLLTQPNEWVEFYDDLLGKDIEEMSKIDAAKEGQVTVGLDLVFRLAKGWSFEDEFTKANLLKLSSKDVMHVAQKATEISRSNLAMKKKAN
jgi:hypothetical protein